MLNDKIFFIDNSTTTITFNKSGTYCNTEWKNMKIYQHVVYFEENKLSIRKKGPQYCITPFYSKDIAMFNELVIKNTTVKELVNFNFVLST